MKVDSPRAAESPQGSLGTHCGRNRKPRCSGDWPPSPVAGRAVVALEVSEGLFIARLI